MQGYKPQYDDHNQYIYDGQRVDSTLLADCIAIDGHDHADEIKQLMLESYRPEQLHNNGDIHDEFNPDQLQLARVTHEKRIVSHADLAEQAGNNSVLWDSLSDSYSQFVRYTRRWKAGYNPDQHIKPDAFFARKVETARKLMARNTRKRMEYTRRAKQLGIIK